MEGQGRRRGRGRGMGYGARRGSEDDSDGATGGRKEHFQRSHSVNRRGRRTFRDKQRWQSLSQVDLSQSPGNAQRHQYVESQGVKENENFKVRYQGQQDNVQRSHSVNRRGRRTFRDEQQRQRFSQVDLSQPRGNAQYVESQGVKENENFKVKYQGEKKRENFNYHREKKRESFEVQRKKPRESLKYQKEKKRENFKVRLKSWAEETNPSELILQMANETEGLADLLEETYIEPDCYDLLLKICKLILSASHQKIALKKVLALFVTSHFFGQSLHRLVERKMIRKRPEAVKFFDEVLQVVTEIINSLPEFAGKMQMTLVLLIKMVNDIVDIRVKKGFLKTISILEIKVKKLEEGNRDKLKYRKRTLPYDDTDTPPEDFRELSVIPRASDLKMDADPFIRAIISKGAYRNEEHYLDVQFRLMREDFIQPLRKGLNEFKSKGCPKNYKSFDIRLYFDVQIIGMTFVNSINHVLQFDMTSLKSVNLEQSKRFLNGSLVCLSKDNFETILFAKVAFSTPSKLKKGIIIVDFMTGLHAIFCASPTDVFVMAESTAYFGAYEQVLEGLKEWDSSISLQKYFISCKETLKPPEYLLGGVARYDLSSLTKVEHTTPVSILNTLSWPKVEMMNLNISQREAAQLALTKELAIIQGPPGTGKTYVGLKVMKVLLENQSIIPGHYGDCYGPILVVCYTNHALDQFLEGVHKFCPEGLVRVGGKCSSVEMEPLNLKNLKKNKDLSPTERKALWIANCRMKHISNKIEELKSKIDSLYIGVQRETSLQRLMLPKHFTSLMDQCYDRFSSANDYQMRYWLNAPKNLNKETLPLLIRNKMTELVLQVSEVVFKDFSSYSEQHVKAIFVKMHVFDRARLYQGWLKHFFSGLDLYRYENARIYEKSRGRILLDNEVVLPQGIFQLINSLNYTTSKNSIESWVLGLGNNLSDQLDDIEILSQILYQNEPNGDEENDEDGTGDDSERLRINDVDFNDEQKIAQSMKKVKEGDAFLLLKAEKLGLGNETESAQNGDGWQTVTHKKPLTFSKLRYYLTHIPPMTEKEEKDVNDLWRLDERKKFALYNLWISRVKSLAANEMEELAFEYEEAVAGKKEIRMEEDLRILKKARVIGMTTTGAAKYRAMLQAVACRIIFVEEAAEVLETHIITALNKDCKHLILIGDHQQLKPNPTVYTLAKHYNLDLSLFERLINNGIHHVTLKEQHRMRKSISKIMRHIYPDLQDHISVSKYDDVRGVQKNIFFIEHTKHESEIGDTKSKSNAHEASYIVSLFRYLLKQGYDASLK